MADDPQGTALPDPPIDVAPAKKGGGPASRTREASREGLGAAEAPSEEARRPLPKAEALLPRRVKLLVLCGAAAFLASTALNVGLGLWASTFATGPLFVVMCAMWLGWGPLTRRVPVRAIAHGTLGACVVAIALIALGEGTTRTPNLHFLCLIVVASALLLGVRASRFWTAVTLLASVGAYTADVLWLGASGVIAFNHWLGLTIMLVVLHLLASAAWRVADASMEESDRAAERARSAAIELEKANLALSSAMQARSQFLANMSHEIRTPLNAVLGFTDVLLRTSLDDDQRQHTETIRGAGEGLLVIVDDVLDLARIEAGKLTFSRDTLDVADAIGATLDMLGVAAHKKGLELWMEVAPGAPTHLEADAARVRQVLLNLLGNAVKFTVNGEIVVTLRRGEGEKSARIEVRDTGIGIAESARGELFQPFGQADASRRRRHDGTGLGLVISKKLVEGMGGRIGFTSELGKGSCFWFELPSVKRSPAPPPSVPGLSLVLVTGRPSHGKHLAALLGRHAGAGLVTLPSSASADEIAKAAPDPSKAIAVVDWDPAAPSPAALVTELAELGERLLGIVLLAPLSEKVDGREKRWPKRVAVLQKPAREPRLLSRLLAIGGGGQAPTSTPPPPSRFQHRVLLVEDNPVNQTIGRLMLQSSGCSVQIAPDGVHAVRAVASGDFDLVLMDLHMPDMDGFDATRAIRDEERQRGRGAVPIVALSASVLPEDQARCLDVGMNGHLAKPISRKELEDLLRSVPLKDTSGHAADGSRSASDVPSPA